MVFFLALTNKSENGDRALNLTFIYLFITRQGLIVTAVLEAVSKVLIGNFYFNIIGLVHNMCHHESPRLAFPHFASQIFQSLFFRRTYKMLKWALINPANQKNPDTYY